MVHLWLNMFENTVYEYNIHDIYNYTNVDIMHNIWNCYEMDIFCSFAILSTSMYTEWYQNYNKKRTSLLNTWEMKSHNQNHGKLSWKKT